MITFIIGAVICWGTWGVDQWQIRYKESKLKRFNQGDIIWEYRDYMNKTGQTWQVVANGGGYCRGEIYRRFRLPFQSQYKEVKKEGELDSCTGEIYHDGKWQIP